MKEQVPDRVELSLDDGFLVVRIPVKQKIVPELVERLTTDREIILPRMTGRKRQIFDAMREGLCAKEIAERFQLAISTAKFWISRVYEVLGVHDRSSFYAVYGIQKKSVTLTEKEKPFNWKKELKEPKRKGDRDL
jgi:DNA-binding CsgD family transcriptional regulator